MNNYADYMDNKAYKNALYKMLRAMEPTAFATIESHKKKIITPYGLTKIENAEKKIKQTKDKLIAGLKALAEDD